MKFIADQDVYAMTVSFLRGLGHDVFTAADLGMSREKDSQLLRTAHDQGRIFVTRDRDFGALVFVQASGPGVIYLRILPAMVQQCIPNSHESSRSIASSICKHPS